jgi:hypothetical protein
MNFLRLSEIGVWDERQDPEAHDQQTAEGPRLFEREIRLSLQ